MEEDFLDERWYNLPPILGSQNTPLLRHKDHCREMNHQSNPIRDRTHVINETNSAYCCQTCQEPRIGQPEKNAVYPNRYKKDHTSTSQCNMRVRTAKIGFVDDIEMIGNSEIE